MTSLAALLAPPPLPAHLDRRARALVCRAAAVAIELAPRLPSDATTLLATVAETLRVASGALGSIAAIPSVVIVELRDVLTCIAITLLGQLEAAQFVDALKRAHDLVGEMDVWSSDYRVAAARAGSIEGPVRDGDFVVVDLGDD